MVVGFPEGLIIRMVYANIYTVWKPIMIAFLSSSQTVEPTIP